MALNFPSSPTNNQVFDNWIYSSDKGAWEAKPLTPGVATPSPTAPLAPKQGDLWYNTEDGNTYVWYTDVDGSQWVQLKSDATLSSTLGTRVESLEATPSGLVPVSPTSVTVASGSASVTSLGKINFTDASAITLNNIFNSNYLNYRVVITCGQSATGEIRIRFSSSGTPAATNYYYGSGRFAGNVFDNYSGTNIANIALSLGSSGGRTSINSDIYAPATSGTTGITWQSAALNSGYGLSLAGGGNHQGVTVFDGIYIFAASGNITGTMQVFGYR